MHIKVKSIIITFLFLFVASTQAHATVYFYFDAENGTVGTNLPNPPICQTECSGSGARGTYQSSGGAPQGSNYFQWQTVANQTNTYTEIHPSPNFPITNVLGKTYYLAWFFNFTRISGLDIWHETGDSADKAVEIDGSGVRWTWSPGNWITLAPNQDHRYTIFIGNPTYHLNLLLEHGDIYWPNQNGYTYTNTLQLQYEQWYSAVMAVKIAADNTGSVTLYIDGVKIFEYTNIRTAANTSPTITDIKMSGSIAQNAYDAPAHLRKFDALMLTDNWQDIVNGGYLSSGGDGGGTPPPSSGGGGDSGGASGGSGCGFVKEDGKGQEAKGEGLSLMIMLIIALAGIAIVRKIAINKGSKGVEHIKKMICLMSCSKCIWLLIMVIASTALVNTSHAAVLAEQNFDDPSIANKYATLGEHTWLPGGWDSWLQAGNCNTDSSMSINSNAAYRGSAGLDIYYHMDDDPRGDCALHMDNNTSLVHTFLPGLSHYFVRGYFRLPFSTAELCYQPWIQRKLIYFKPQNYGTGSSFFIVAWPWANCSTDGYSVSVAYGGPNGMDNTLWGNGSPGFFPTNNHLRVNTWYYIEAEVEYGTYGHDTLRIWLAPAGTLPNLIFERTDLTLRSSSDVAVGITLGTMEIGRQVDIVRDSFSQGIDEHRYWDEIVISTTPIGPLDGGSSDNTPPPSSGGGGDSGGGSGGSGCGFVKDDGKGQKAKGEGLAFAIMLIISLAGIALFKRRRSNIRLHEKERADI